MNIKEFSTNLHIFFAKNGLYNQKIHPETGDLIENIDAEENDEYTYKSSFKDYLRTDRFQDRKNENYKQNKKLPYEQFAHILLSELHGLMDHNKTKIYQIIGILYKHCGGELTEFLKNIYSEFLKQYIEIRIENDMNRYSVKNAKKKKCARIMKEISRMTCEHIY